MQTRLYIRECWIIKAAHEPIAPATNPTALPVFGEVMPCPIPRTKSSFARVWKARAAGDFQRCGSRLIRRVSTPSPCSSFILCKLHAGRWKFSKCPSTLLTGVLRRARPVIILHSEHIMRWHSCSLRAQCHGQPLPPALVSRTDTSRCALRRAMRIPGPWSPYQVCFHLSTDFLRADSLWHYPCLGQLTCHLIGRVMATRLDRMIYW